MDATISERYLGKSKFNEASEVYYNDEITWENLMKPALYNFQSSSNDNPPDPSRFQ